MNNVDWSKYDSEDTTPIVNYTPPKQMEKPKVVDWAKYEEPTFDEPQEQEEGFFKSATRTALQIPQGLADVAPYGVATGLWQMLGLGDALDPDEIEHIRKISEREGVPFDEEKYRQSAQDALSFVPTVSNLAHKVEEETGIPLDPKSRADKALRFLSSATRLSPGKTNPSETLQFPGTFRGLKTELPRPILGAGVTGAKEILQEIIPEPLAELASFGILKQAPKGAASLDIGKKTKPSGLVERRFENTTQPTEISASRLDKINSKLETDFKNISDKIIKDSPVGETAANLSKDPTYKQQSRELLNEAQVIADQIPGSIKKETYVNALANRAKQKEKGFSLSEYDKNYNKLMLEAPKDIVANEITHGQLVEQYRKNNGDLSEYFEPGASKSLNRAKRNVILDRNRAIADIIETTDPSLSKVFKEGNERWSKIMDAEAVDGFISELFTNNVNYKKMDDFFDKTGYDHIFKRALGEQGYKDFSQLMKDMLTSQAPYKMLKVAKEKGWGDLYKTGMAYVIDPHLGKAKGIFEASKYLYKSTMNAMLDKPSISFTWKQGIDSLKKGDFKSADKAFKTLHGEVLEASKPIKTENVNVSKEEALKKYNAREIPEKPLDIEGDNFRDNFMSKKTGNDVLEINDPKIQLKKLKERRDSIKGNSQEAIKERMPLTKEINEIELELHNEKLKKNKRK